jgi:hypothetical protein
MGGTFRTHKRDEKCAINSVANPGQIQPGSAARDMQCVRI